MTSRRPPLLARLALGLLAALGLAALPGCMVGGAFAHVFFPEKVKPKYLLSEERPTLVMVEDPHGALGDAAMVSVIATQAGFHLKEQEVVLNLVEASRLYDLQQRWGDRYATTPIDRIGREVGATQVVHVTIHSVGMFSEPGLLKPTAVTSVKVIHVNGDKGARVFPAAEGDAALPGMPPAPGERVVTTFRHKIVGDDTSSLDTVLRRSLAERIGRDVSRVFYEYEVRELGLDN